MVKPTVTFYYDVISPFSLFAFDILRRYQSKWGIEIIYKPAFLGGVMAASKNQPPANVVNKGELRDIEFYIYFDTNLPFLACTSLSYKGTHMRAFDASTPFSTQSYEVNSDMKILRTLEKELIEFVVFFFPDNTDYLFSSRIQLPMISNFYGIPTEFPAEFPGKPLFNPSKLERKRENVEKKP